MTSWILVARPWCTHSLRVKSVSISCDGIRICGRQLCSSHHVYKNLWDVSVRGKLLCTRESESGNKKDPWCEGIPFFGHVLGRYQLPARYFCGKTVFAYSFSAVFFLTVLTLLLCNHDTCLSLGSSPNPSLVHIFMLAFAASSRQRRNYCELPPQFRLNVRYNCRKFDLAVWQIMNALPD